MKADAAAAKNQVLMGEMTQTKSGMSSSFWVVLALVLAVVGAVAYKKK